MFKGKKMFFVLALSAVMALTGCAGNNGGNNGNTAGNGGASTAPSEPPKAGDEPVTIQLHTFGNEATYNWAKTVAAFEEKYPNIKVNVNVLSEKGDTQEAIQKLDLAASSGEQMDVIMFSDPASYAQRVGLGMVAPLDEFIAAEGYKVNEDYKVDTTLNGKVYALPGKFNPWYVLLNKTDLDKAGLEVPTDWTWEDFATYAKTLTTGEGAGKHYGTYFHGPQNGGWMEFMKLALANQPDNTEFLKEDGTMNFDNPLFRKTLELRVQMEKEDASATPYTDMLSQKLHYRNQFFNQAVSMIMIGSWMNTELGGTEQFPLNFDVAVAPIPKNDAADEGGYTMVTTDYVSVAESSKNKEAAYQFVRWYTTDGQIAQGKNIPAWNGVDQSQLESIIDIILSGTKNPEKVNKASLVNTLSNAKSSKIIPPVTYQSEMYKVINEEYEKLIYGQQDIDQVIAALNDRVQKIIDANK
ncbi:extracellular solute-binding protein [Paenibacillus sp. LHD-117]|uniref:ABC transporter substrate-binding protein n=1 Tax=Paenibacillus sp. LHD-117 TaxID=3071412 RepID=UPI0027DED5E6|nr:extracellular solute-binding protein [Paenibacillus sp. LHD-117]MDQ6422785.1 extracellular solute-binding protein [Paenibacillus sp. LHD-117]